MNVDQPDDDFEPEYAVVPEGEQLQLDEAPADAGTHVRRAAIGITAGTYKDMAIIPRSEANALLRSLRAEPLPFGGYVGYYEGKDVEMRHLDMTTPVCDRYWPGVTEFLYGPANTLEPALRQVGIEPTPLPADFMDPFERGLARYAIYGV